jgi:hypothetical protein
VFCLSVVLANNAVYAIFLKVTMPQNALQRKQRPIARKKHMNMPVIQARMKAAITAIVLFAEIRWFMIITDVLPFQTVRQTAVLIHISKNAPV